MLKKIWISMRPIHWVKNLLVFAGLLFSQNFFSPPHFLKSLFAFALFCGISSSVYILNDILDLKHDKLHPIKSKRPLASGELSLSSGLIFSLLLGGIAIILSFLLQKNFGLIVVIYFFLNLLYSTHLKQVVILDVMCVAAGFVLRAVAGAIVIEVTISSWLVVCTILLALFLGFSKRRHELILLEDNAVNHRRILAEYSPYFLDQMIAVVTASTVVAYAFYTLSPEVMEKLGTKYMDLTIPFVLYGIFRYLYLIHQKKEGGRPTKMLLTDKPILINILLWLVAVFLILYL
jgi:4-hydroxybenzoate polyprenyltransferase